MTHPYYVNKARAAFTKVGADPDNCGQVAAWAERHATDGNGKGVLVTAAGDIVGTTFLCRQEPMANYRIDDETRQRYQTDFTILDLATASITYQLGQPVVHIKHQDVGRGQAVPQ